MNDFGFPEDTQAIVDVIEKNDPSDPKSLKRLELMVSKIDALQNEDYDRLEAIRKELAELK
jgi:hypothetical protein